MIPRSSKAKKFILGFLLLCFLLKWRSSKSGLRRENKLGLPTPLLEQPLDRQFNSRRVWVSIGLCYRCMPLKSRFNLIANSSICGTRLRYNHSIVDQAFSHHYQGRIDFTTVNLFHSAGMDLACILASREGLTNPLPRGKILTNPLPVQD